MENAVIRQIQLEREKAREACLCPLDAEQVQQIGEWTQQFEGLQFEELQFDGGGDKRDDVQFDYSEGYDNRKLMSG